MKIPFVVSLIIAFGTSASADNAQRILRVERFLGQNNLALSDCVRHDNRFQKCQGYGTVTAIIDTQSAIVCIQNTNLALNYGTGQENYGYPCMLPYSSRVTPTEQTGLSRAQQNFLRQIRGQQEEAFRNMQWNIGVDAPFTKNDPRYVKFTFCDSWTRSNPAYACETLEGKRIYFVIPEEPLSSNASSTTRLACSYHRGFASAMGYEENIVNRFTQEELNDVCSRAAIRYGLFNQ